MIDNSIGFKFKNDEFHQLLDNLKLQASMVYISNPDIDPVSWMKFSKTLGDMQLFLVNRFREQAAYNKKEMLESVVENNNDKRPD